MLRRVRNRERHDFQSCHRDAESRLFLPLRATAAYGQEIALAAGNRSKNDKRLFAGSHCLWQRRVWCFVRQVFLAGKEAQECAALLGGMIADRAFQHRIAFFHRVENGSLRHWAFDLNFDFVANVCQRPKVLR